MIANCAFIFTVEISKQVTVALVYLINIVVHTCFQPQHLSLLCAIRNRYTDSYRIKIAISKSQIPFNAERVVEKLSLERSCVAEILICRIRTIFTVDKIPYCIGCREAHRSIRVKDRRRRVSLIGNIAPDISTFASSRWVSVFGIIKIDVIAYP